MINDYQLDRGSIWEVFYFTKTEMRIDPQTEQLFIDRQTREISSSTFDPPSGLSPGEYSQLFMTHFMKSREKSREVIDKNKQKLTRYKMLVQVGNAECVTDLLRIQSEGDFHSWENESMIEYFRKISQEYLNG